MEQEMLCQTVFDVHNSRIVPTMYYNGRSKDKKSILRVSINKRYLAVEHNSTSSMTATVQQQSTLSTNRVSFIDWRMVRKIQFKQNRMKIVPTKINYPKIKAYFDSEVLKYLRKTCKQMGYIQPEHRFAWLHPGRSQTYRPGSLTRRRRKRNHRKSSLSFSSKPQSREHSSRTTSCASSCFMMDFSSSSSSSDSSQLSSFAINKTSSSASSLSSSSCSSSSTSFSNVHYQQRGKKLEQKEQNQTEDIVEKDVDEEDDDFNHFHWNTEDEDDFSSECCQCSFGTYSEHEERQQEEEIRMINCQHTSTQLNHDEYERYNLQNDVNVGDEQFLDHIHYHHHHHNQEECDFKYELLSAKIANLYQYVHDSTMFQERLIGLHHQHQTISATPPPAYSTLTNELNVPQNGSTKRKHSPNDSDCQRWPLIPSILEEMGSVYSLKMVENVAKYSIWTEKAFEFGQRMHSAFMDKLGGFTSFYWNYNNKKRKLTNT